MPHRRTIALLLWAGPAYVIAYLAVVVVNLTTPLFELRVTNPLMYGILMMPLGIFLVVVAFGVWFSLRAIVGRHMPIGTLRHIPFGQLRLRLDEILPAAAGLTVACPALLYVVPHLVAFPTARQIFLVQTPGVLSGWLVAGIIWSMPVSRAMKIFQVVAPILMVLGGLIQSGFAGERLYTTIFGQVLGGSAYVVWLFITPIWLSSLMREQSAPLEWAESRSS